MSRSHHIARSLVSSLLLAVLAAPAFAGHGAPRSVRVSYADLDLTTPAGSAALAQRVRAAARKVCRAGESRAAASQVAWRECLEAALDGATAADGSRALEVDRVVARMRDRSPRS